MSPRKYRLDLARLPVQTDRLTLERPTAARIPEYPPLLGDRRVSRMLLRVGYPYRRADAAEFISRARANYRAGTALALVVADAATGELVGGIGLHRIDWVHRNAELGYWFGRKFWGRGYASEAVQGMLTLAFRQLRLHRIEAAVFAGNRRSEHVLRKAGFRREGLRREAFWREGRWWDDEEFGLTVADWTARRKRASRSPRSETPG